MKKFLIVLFHVLFVAITLWHVNITISDYLANRFYTHDVGVVDYRIYHTTQGNFFFDVVQGRSGFGLHFQPSLLLLLPFHMVLRHILFLPLLQTLALASAAWAVAWLTSLLIQRDRENGESGGLTVAGMLAGWIFLTNPHVGSIFLAHHYDSITAALGLWALAFLASGRRWVFWVLLLIALGLKEDGPVHWFVFAPWWLLWGWKANGEGFAEGWRKRLGFSIRLAVVCTVFAFVALLVIMWTAHSDGYEALFFAKRYTGAEDAQRPFFATVFGPLWQMGKLLLPFFAFLPLAAPSTLLLLVAPAYQMGLAEEAQQNLLYYYSYAFMPFLGLGTALGLRRIAGLLQRLDHARLRRSIKCGGAVLLFLLGAWM
ncbi:MAG: DUF2079 domain-containing protein, partial [Candidatus Sumerlaeota bacterium]